MHHVHSFTYMYSNNYSKLTVTVFPQTATVHAQPSKRALHEYPSYSTIILSVDVLMSIGIVGYTQLLRSEPYSSMEETTIQFLA